jgi:hypothetical protein
MQSNTECISPFSQSVSDCKKMKRESWSGPIPNKAGVKESSSMNEHRSPIIHPNVIAKSHGHSWQPSSVSPKVPPKILPNPTISPKISELHELHRPPVNVESLKSTSIKASNSNSYATSSCFTKYITNSLTTSTTAFYSHSQLLHTLK